jgi:hypothetical protein
LRSSMALEKHNRAPGGNMTTGPARLSAASA